MAALFYSYSKDDIFKTNIGGLAPARIDFFANMLGGQMGSEKYMCIITQLGVATNDIVQFFMSFDDVIHHYYFGKGIGTVTVNGILLRNCDGYLPGLDQIYSDIGPQRGIKTGLSIGAAYFDLILQEFNLTLTSEPETMVDFVATFSVVGSDMPSPKFEPLC